jgi:phosphatidylinositol glycan class T
VSLGGTSARDTQAAFEALTQTLGGMLCAGIATMPQLGVLAVPAVGWFGGQQPPAVSVAAANGTAARQVYGYLPQEGVCSENLGAWRRLLPCRGHAGLAALLHAPQLAAAPYHSLGLHMWVEQAGEQARLQLRHALTAVLPLPTDASERRGPLEALFGAEQAPPACPAAAAAALYVAAQQQRAGAQDGLGAAAASSQGGCRASGTVRGPLLVCTGTLQPAAQPKGQAAQQPHLPPALLGLLAPGGDGGAADGGRASGQPEGWWLRVPPQVVQQVVPAGPLSGTLVVGVRVAAAEEAALLHVLQLVPWQLQADASSLRVSLDNHVSGQGLAAPANLHVWDAHVGCSALLLHSFPPPEPCVPGFRHPHLPASAPAPPPPQALQPGSPELVWQVADARPDRTATLELLLRLPPDREQAAGAPRWREVRVRVGYRAAFVGVFDHAPDASRGVPIPPAVVSLLPEACAADSGSRDSSLDGGPDAPLLRRLHAVCGVRQQYSSSAGGALVPVPLPDFSMPFNVACFSSTLLAVLLGGVANVVLRWGPHRPGCCCPSKGPLGARAELA